MMEDLQERLLELADPAYRKFHSSLLPGTENILGVRTPELRKLAKEIRKGDWETFLLENGRRWYENDILQGLVIAEARMKPEKRIEYIKNFLPRIENWAVCDIFCGSLKEAGKYPALYEPLLRACLISDKPFEIRFGVVMLLDHYRKREYLEEIFNSFDKIESNHYYVRMAIAWAVSVYYVHFPEETLSYLDRCSLDDWTYNKALQKIIESQRVLPEEKEKIRSRKRKSGR